MKAALHKSMKSLIRKAIFCTAVVLSTIALEATPVSANPTGGQVSAGSATISSSGTTLNVNQTTNRAVIDWRGFDIAAGETTNFVQPSSSSMTLNRVNSGSPSQIFGHLTANGNIEIINPSGVLFGAGSHVDVNGLVATTANISNQAFMNGGQLAFSQPGDPNASIINNGTITAADAGLVGLVAPNVVNNGIITAKLGTVHLASADSFTLDLYGDGLMNFAVSPSVQKQLVQNEGTISAAGGKINLTAAAGSNVVDSLIKVSGKLSAPAVSEKNGHIYIYAQGGKATVDGNVDASGTATGTKGGDISVLGDDVEIKDTAVLDASGDAGGGNIKIGGDFHGAGTTPTALNTTVDSGAQIRANANTTGNGGNVVVWSDDETQFSGHIEATGGAQSGNGGYVETSGHQLLSFDGTVDLLAPHGATGSLLLDPENVTITNNASVTDTCSSGLCTPTGDTSYLNVTTLNNALASSNVTVTTGAGGAQTGNITVSGTADAGGAVAINWSTGNLLTLSAAGNIIIDSGATITNTYNVVNGTFGISTIPVVLALRADSASVNGNATAAGSSYGVTNNGTINMSGSSGAVSIFNDWNFTPVNGTQTANGSWSAATYAPNYSVSNQFTTYKLINSTADLVSISTDATTLGGTYALGKTLDGGGGAINGNGPLGLFTGILDGQYGALTGGSVYNITNYTLTNNTAGNIGLFNANNGIMRNFGIGITVTDNYTGTVNQEVGSIAGENDNIIANVSALASGSINMSTNLSGAQMDSPILGGLVGYTQNNSLIINSTAANNINYTYNGTTTSNNSLGWIGGLVGLNVSALPLSIVNSSASGNVTTQYGAGASGVTQIAMGGLAGVNYTGTAIVNSFATGNVTDGMGANSNVGGLVGFNQGTIEGINGGYSYYNASGSGVTYTANSGSAGVGGLVGSNYGTITRSYNASNITYTGNAALSLAGLSGFNGGTGTISNSYNTGSVSYTGNSGVQASVGGLVGENDAPVSNSYSTGNVSYSSGNSTGLVGGLLGENSSTVTNSYASTGTVTITNTASGTSSPSLDIGGFVGYNQGPVSGSHSSQNVIYNDQSTSSAQQWALEGGFAGFNASTIDTSYAGGNVTAQYSNGASGGIIILAEGGFIGLNGLSTAGMIQTSFATGNVYANLVAGTGLTVIGGFVGDNLSTSAMPISDSYATGAVTMSSGASGYAGAFAGDNNDNGSGASISHVYATGLVANPAGTSGGLIAYNATTIGANNYWDTNTTGQASTSNGGTSQTTAQLQSALPTGFSSSTWGIVAGTSYPYLLWQVSGTPQVVSGTAYSDRGVTPLAGGTVSGLLNGVALNGGQSVSTGANGYYYFLLPSGGLNGAGSELLTYLTGATKGNTLDDGISGSTTGVNIWSNTLRLVSSTGTPASLAGGLATAMGSNSGSNFLGTGSTTGGIDSIITTAGDIDLASNISWSNSDELLLSARNNLYIDAGVTIANTYNIVNGTFAEGNIPVVLALRGDSGSVNGNATAAGSSYGVINNGTIDMSGSSGAVSIFSDWNFTPVSGTQTANGSWAHATYAPNYAVFSQFTPYRLINSTADLVAVGTNATTLGYIYALGTNINGGGAAFNGNTPLGTLSGALDGQYCALVGGSVCGVTGFTMTSSAATVGLFGTNNGTIRNLSIGLNVTDNSSNIGTDNVGTLVGNDTGIIANVSATGSVNYTTTVGGASTPTGNVGGLVGQLNTANGIIINSSASGNVTYTYAGTSTGSSTADVGGLVGLNTSTAATSISGSNATGTVAAQYSATGCGGGPCSGTVSGAIGGLIGQSGGANAVATSSNYATGNVSSSLSGATIEEVGGLIGYDASTSATNIINSYATGTVSYTGTGAATSAFIGGLVGTNANGGTIKGTGASYSYATGGVSSTGATTGNVFIGGLAGNDVGTITQAYSSGNVSYSGAAPTVYIGGLLGIDSNGNISNISAATESVSATNTVAGAATSTLLIGGLVGQVNAGTLTSLSTSGNVTYTYAGTSSGTSIVLAGGLIGKNLSTAATSLSGSNASGNVTAQYSATGCGGGPCSGKVLGYIGGLIGQSGANTAVATSSNYATGNVSSSLAGANESLGGLIGVDQSTSATSIVNSYYQTGTVSYTGTGAAGTAILMGGLVGWNVGGGTIAGTGGLYSYASSGISYSGSATANFYLGGLVGATNGPITQAYSTGNVSFSDSASAVAFIGGLAGYNSGVLSNITAATESVSSTITVSGAATNTLYIGGLVGYNLGTGTLTNLSTSGNVTYTYAGTSSGTSTAVVGGLVGLNVSTAATSISGSNASGVVTAQYSATGCGGGPCSGNVYGNIGGLIGQNGVGNAVATSSNYATGNVNVSLSGNSYEFVGGLIGQNASTSLTDIVNSYYQTGTISYTGTGGTIQTSIGGLVGVTDFGGTIKGTGGLYSYASGGINYSGNATGTFYIGGLVGNNAGGAITQAYSTGNVSFSGSAPAAYIGGLVGASSGALSNISAATESVSGTTTVSGAATSTLYIGGLVGQNTGTGTLTGLSTSGNVTYTYGGTSSGMSAVAVGGFVGWNNSTAATSISGSNASGTVTAQYSTTGCGGGPCSGNVTGYIGGLIGQSGNNDAVVMSSNFASGRVASSLAGAIGGLVGLDDSTAPQSIMNSYATGAVSYAGNFSSAYTGGLVGQQVFNTSSIVDSYSTGYVSSTSPSTAGGLVGANGGTVTNSYWDTQTSGQSTSAGGTGQTTAQLQAALPTGFNGATWGIVAGTSYPYLLWQVPVGTPQVVTGTAYSARGVTPLAGASVGLTVGGTAGSLLGSTQTSGANGYYYFLLAPGAISGSGTNVRTYLTSGGTASGLADAATGSVTGLNVYGPFTTNDMPNTVAWVSQNLPVPGTIVSPNTSASNVLLNAALSVQGIARNTKQNTIPNYNTSGSGTNGTMPSVTTLGGILNISPELVQMFDLGYLQNRQ